MPRGDPAAVAWLHQAESQTADVQDALDELGAEGHDIKLCCPQVNGDGGRCLRVIATLAPEGSNGAVMPLHLTKAYMQNDEWRLNEDHRVGVDSRRPYGLLVCEIPGCPGQTKKRFCPAHASGREYQSQLAPGWGHRVRIWCPGRKCPYERTVTMARLAQLFVVAIAAGSTRMWVE